MSFFVRRNVGKLITAQLASPLSDADVEGTVAAMRNGFVTAPSKVIAIGELTRLTVLTQAHAEVFTAMFTKDNPKLERSAFLLARDKGVFAMQLERMIKEAGNPMRRTFTDAAELKKYVEPFLDDAERAELSLFLTKAAAAVLT